MPLYEYHCSKCGKTFELMRKFSDPDVKVHEECGGEVEQLLSAPAFQLKGTGWYVTDYGKGGSKIDAAKSKESGESKTESKSESKNDSKSDSKSGDSSSNSSSSSSESASTKSDSKPAASKSDS